LFAGSRIVVASRFDYKENSVSVTPIIELKSIGKSFPGVRALDDISFSVQPGELHAICGENGAGKSTLMKILSGVITDFEGTLCIDGANVSFGGTADAEKAGVSIIHQELNLVEQLSVAANVFLGREVKLFSQLRNDRAMNRSAATLLESLECGISPKTLAGSLRIGDQQLVEIAKALSLHSRILIMDEPTSALTESEVARLYRVIARLLNDGTTILYISHKMDEVFRLANRITVLRDGRFIATRNKAETDASEITRLMVGRELSSFSATTRSPSKECVLEVQGLSLGWPGHARGYRLHDISFQLHRGEILGIAGLMGAGRTELLECIFGAASQMPSGDIYLEGRRIVVRNPSEACRLGIALVTEDRKRLGLFPEMSVGKNIAMCALRQMLTGRLLNKRKERNAAQSMVEKLQVRTAGLANAITALSGGNQQKCILGRWLLTRPKVLLLDDPTRGIDVGAKAELYSLIQTLCQEGLSVIVTSSEMPELLALCDRIMVLNEGRQTAMFDRTEATQPLIMEAASRGLPTR
jgi:ribose transport system ATP-binding protein